MQPMMTSGLVAVILGLFAGCAAYDPELVDDVDVVLNEYEAVREMAPQGPKFNQGLRQGYLDYGDLQYEGADYTDFTHFAFKAVDSAKGKNVLPDEVESRDVPATTIKGFTVARARLMGALEQGGRKRAPWQAADAQTAFDCWIERQEENASPADIAACKGRFEENLTALERAIARDTGDVHLVFFPWNQAGLTPIANEVLDQIVEDLKAGKKTTLLVTGHADASGSSAYNDALSKNRAEIVAKALAGLGVDEEALTIEWYGETRPRVERDDGVREPQNRRVEVTPKD